MKRIILAVLTVCLLFAFCLTAFAETPEADENQKLVESLYKGIVPVTPETSYEELVTMMEIVDESEGKMYTAKLVTFFELISLYYYEDLSVADVYSRFANAVDSIDINNMEETYTTLFTLFDKFSYYLTPEQAEQFFAPTASKGIGISMAWRDATDLAPSGIYVEEIAKGSPAEIAGIAVGDRIVGFNGHDMEGLGFEALSVYLSNVAADAPSLSVTMERRTEEGVQLQSYNLERKVNSFSEYSIVRHPEKNLIYLDINSFMTESSIAYDLINDIDKAWAEGYRNVIVDLQGNTGGDVALAAEVMSKFTSEAELLFYVKGNKNTVITPFVSRGNGYDFDSVTILVDEGTASSAEIFAYVLDEVADAFIVGELTKGKGVAQSVFSFVDGAACGITTFVVYDKFGNTYNEKGVVPDVIVEGKTARNILPSMPSLTALNFNKAVEGAENSVVKGLEMRLEIIGFLAPEKVDGVWDSVTTLAVMAFQQSLGYEATGTLDINTYHALIKLVEIYGNTYYYTYTPFDYAYRFVGFR